MAHLIPRLTSVSANSAIFVQEYEELNHKLNVFKEREHDLRERLHNYHSRQNHNKMDENTNKMGMIKLKLPPNQNFNSHPNSSPNSITSQTPPQSVSSPLNLNQCSNRNDADSSNISTNIAFEHSDGADTEVVGNMLLIL